MQETKRNIRVTIGNSDEMSTNKEIWKNAYGIEDCYLVSNYGNIISLSRYVTIPNKTPFLKPMNTMKKRINMDGYYSFIASVNSKRKDILIHRLVAQTFIQNTDKTKCIINHKDGDKLNNFYKNLEWCTTQENTHHAKVNNLVNYGEKCHKSKLKEVDVLNIRKEYKKGDAYKIANKYNVTPHLIYLIINREIWKRI